MVALNLESFLSLKYSRLSWERASTLNYLALSNFKSGTGDSPKVVEIWKWPASWSNMVKSGQTWSNLVKDGQKNMVKKHGQKKHG